MGADDISLSLYECFVGWQPTNTNLKNYDKSLTNINCSEYIRCDSELFLFGKADKPLKKKMIREELEHKIEQACDLLKLLLDKPDDDRIRTIALNFIAENSEPEIIQRHYTLTELKPEDELGF